MRRGSAIGVIACVGIACSSPPGNPTGSGGPATSSPEITQRKQDPASTGTLEPAKALLLGRFDGRDPAAPAYAWPGGRIAARFRGTAVRVVFRETAEDWMEGAPSEWDVTIDGAARDKVVTKRGEETYPIATDLAAGEHAIELTKRTEAQNGVTTFLRLELPNGGVALDPPPRPARRIEVIGDSAPAGFGVEGLDFPDLDCPGADEGARWQNFDKSFGALLGGTFGAELFGTVYSGKGIVKNIYRPDTDALPALFDLANPLDTASTWDFSAKPDVVIVMIGGNDFAEGQPDESADGAGPATAAEFTSAYRAFVTTLRAKYPDAHLFLTVSPSVSDTEPAGRRTRTNILTTTQTIARERTTANDAKVYAFAPGVADPAELTGCGGHGTPALHARVAAEIGAQIKARAGW